MFILNCQPTKKNITFFIGRHILFFALLYHMVFINIKCLGYCNYLKNSLIFEMIFLNTKALRYKIRFLFIVRITLYE